MSLCYFFEYSLSFLKFSTISLALISDLDWIGDTEEEIGLYCILFFDGESTWSTDLLWASYSRSEFNIFWYYIVGFEVDGDFSNTGFVVAFLECLVASSW